MNTSNYYNAGLKEAFMETSTSKVMLNNIFNISAPMEKSLNKDCCDFVLPEILILMRAFESSSAESLRVKISLLRSYTTFAIERNFSKDGLNHYDEVTTKDYESLIDKHKYNLQYFTYDEVQKLLLNFSNARDQYLILAPYEGVYGKDLCEIINLTTEDLLPDHKIRTCTGRILQVSEQLYDIMQEAGRVDDYISSEGKIRALRSSKLIYKTMDTVSTPTKPNKTMLVRRMEKIRKSYEIPSLGFSMLKRSGMFNALKGYLDGRSIAEHYSDPEVQKIINRFDGNKDKIRVITTYNRYVNSK